MVAVNLSTTHEPEMAFENPLVDPKTGEEVKVMQTDRPGYQALLRCAMLCAKAVFKVRSNVDKLDKTFRKKDHFSFSLTKTI